VYKAGGVLAAVCHGPVGLVTVTDDAGVPVVRGKRVTCFSNAEECTIGRDALVPFSLETRLGELGAIYEAGEKFKAHVSVRVIGAGEVCVCVHVCVHVHVCVCSCVCMYVCARMSAGTQREVDKARMCRHVGLTESVRAPACLSQCDAGCRRQSCDYGAESVIRWW
jgi:hypothetical protein